MFLMRKTIKLVVCALGLLWGAACQKVNPEILSLSKKETPLNLTPANGRVTLGSGTSTSGSYKLKGRISTLEPASNPVGTYRLKGTVQF